MDNPRNINVGSEFPGTWTDAEGAIHFDVPSIHALFGFPDTPEAREETAQMLASILKQKLPPGTKIVLRETPD